MPWLRRVSQECALLGILESISLNLHKPRAARCQRAPNAVKNSCNAWQVHKYHWYGGGEGGLGQGFVHCVGISVCATHVTVSHVTKHRCFNRHFQLIAICNRVSCYDCGGEGGIC